MLKKYLLLSLALILFLLLIGGSFGFIVLSTFLGDSFRVDLKFVLVMIISAVVMNFILLKFFTNPVSRGERIANSIIIILVNLLSIDLLLLLINAGVGVPARFLFLFPLALAFGFKIISSRLEKTGQFFQPYRLIYIYFILLIPIFILNWGFFYRTFHFRGNFTHIYENWLLPYFLIASLAAWLLSHLLNKGFSAKSLTLATLAVMGIGGYLILSNFSSEPNTPITKIIKEEPGQSFSPTPFPTPENDFDPVPLGLLAVSPESFVDGKVQVTGKLINIGPSYYNPEFMITDGTNNFPVNAWVPIEIPPCPPDTGCGTTQTGGEVSTMESYLNKTLTLQGVVKKGIIAKGSNQSFYLNVINAKFSND